MVEMKNVELLVSGGEATAGPPLGPALGPLGINIMAVVTKINELTKDYAGMKVPVKISVNPEDKSFEVSVGTPTASALLVAELKIEKGSGTPNQTPRNASKHIKKRSQRNDGNVRQRRRHSRRQRPPRSTKRSRHRHTRCNIQQE
jgi:ribosomal protein L11